jgi:hypothetical protein
MQGRTVATTLLSRANRSTMGALLPAVNRNNNRVNLNRNNADNQNRNVRCRALARVIAHECFLTIRPAFFPFPKQVLEPEIYE